MTNNADDGHPGAPGHDYIFRSVTHIDTLSRLAFDALEGQTQRGRMRLSPGRVFAEDASLELHPKLIPIERAREVLP